MHGTQDRTPTENEEQHEDYLDNYVEIPEDDDGEKREYGNLYEQSALDRGIEPDNVLSNVFSNVFDNDANDPGYQTLLWY